MLFLKQAGNTKTLYQPSFSNACISKDEHHPREVVPPQWLNELIQSGQLTIPADHLPHVNHFHVTVITLKR